MIFRLSVRHLNKDHIIHLLKNRNNYVVVNEFFPLATELFYQYRY